MVPRGLPPNSKTTTIKLLSRASQPLNHTGPDLRMGEWWVRTNPRLWPCLNGDRGSYIVQGELWRRAIAGDTERRGAASTTTLERSTGEPGDKCRGNGGRGTSVAVLGSRFRGGGNARSGDDACPWGRTTPTDAGPKRTELGRRVTTVGLGSRGKFVERNRGGGEGTGPTGPGACGRAGLEPSVGVQATPVRINLCQQARPTS
mmetsp:Transcript_8940/g.19137  ORF Transcript_8940/g.19137 Transcript_8940/m.19137 type:complete len:203 (-) Transcript_8940:1082-1690(-)